LSHPPGRPKDGSLPLGGTARSAKGAPIYAWLRQGPQHVMLTLHIQPGAKKTELAGEYGDALKIRLAAPPVDGKANACLLDFLAERLGVAKRQVVLVSGESARAKRVRVEGMDAESVRRKLIPA